MERKHDGQVHQGSVNGRGEKRMERLTEYTSMGEAIPRMELRKNGHRRCLARLAEYEDIGLTPRQLRQVDAMYADRCREISELKGRLDEKAHEEG